MLYLILLVFVASASSQTDDGTFGGIFTTASSNFDGTFGGIFTTGPSTNDGTFGGIFTTGPSTNDGTFGGIFTTPSTNVKDRGSGKESTTTTTTIRTTTSTEATLENISCGVGKECVGYYLCENGTILKTGENVLDVRFDATSPCPDYLTTCCNIDDKRDESVLPPVTVRQGCGNHQKNGVGFQIEPRDSEAQFGEFPWMVAVLKEQSIGDKLLNVYVCGGSIIHPEVVLTGAHCMNAKQVEEIKIRAGEWDTQIKTEQYPHQDRNVRQIIMHKDFNKGSLANDVALLILDEPLAIGEIVQPICLPPQNFIFDYSRCFASGWGKDSYGKEGKYQVILKKIELPVVPHNVCQNSLRRTRLGFRFVLNRSFMCAGGEPGKDTCKGDGGSPLVCPIAGSNDKYYQAGIVAWGIGCGENQIPGVYANVAFFRNWIDEQLNILNIESSYYTF